MTPSAAETARRVFVAGPSLAQRWAGRGDFTVVDLAFDVGHTFLVTWQAWRDDPARPNRLHHVAVVPGLPTVESLQHLISDGAEPQLVQQMRAAWPPAVDGLHALDFEQGAVRLLLAVGPLRRLLPELSLRADAFFLGPATADRHLLLALARRAGPRATATAERATPALTDGLTAAGFDIQVPAGPGSALQAHHAPRWATRPAAPTDPDRRVVVIGAGLAGACTAAALATRGYAVQVLDRHAEPAAGSSGNPAGLFHATVHGDDSPYARLFRAAALHTARVLRPLDPLQVPHSADGLLRLEHERGCAAMLTLIDQQQLPPDFVQALDADLASRRAGVALTAPAWFYPQGGWVSPGHLVRQRLTTPGIRFIGSAAVHGLRATAGGWQCLDAQGQVLAEAPQLVLALAEQVNPLLQALGWPAFALGRSRGQVTVFRPQAAVASLRVPVAGSGYVLPLPDGRVLCGATTGDDDDDPRPRDDDHRANIARLLALCGLQAPTDPAGWQGRVGWRVQAADKLPIAGPLAARQFEPGTRLDQARLVPRAPGLHLACGFGARGITLAPLLGDLVAARIAGTPLPLPQSLVDLVDPARWIVREARRSGSAGT